MSHPSASSFSVRSRPAREHLVVEVAGDLDCHTVPAVADEIRAALDADWDDFVLDLRKVTSMDSSGVRLLLTLREMAGTGLRCALADCPPNVDKLLDLLDMTDVLPRIDPHGLAA